MSSDRSRDDAGREPEREGGWNAGYRYRECVDETCSGAPLVAHLTEHYRHSTEDTWRRRVAEGQVTIGGRVVTEPDRRLRTGDTLVWTRPPWREPDGPSTFALLHADRDVLGVAKPRGLPTLPGGGFLEKTLLHRVRAAFPGASPLHRLGRGTSGIVLCSRHRDSRRRWTSEWPRVRRSYLGLVDGHFPPGESDLDFPIGPVPHPVLGTIAAVSPAGKRAVSRVRLVERRETTSLVEVRIETGRTHQIRIHLAAAGHPLASDPLYPRGGIPDPENDRLPGETGYWLHAFRLELDALAIECAPPPILRESSRGGE